MDKERDAPSIFRSRSRPFPSQERQGGIHQPINLRKTQFAMIKPMNERLAGISFVYPFTSNNPKIYLNYAAFLNQSSIAFAVAVIAGKLIGADDNNG